MIPILTTDEAKILESGAKLPGFQRRVYEERNALIAVAHAAIFYQQAIAYLRRDFTTENAWKATLAEKRVLDALGDWMGFVITVECRACGGKGMHHVATCEPIACGHCHGKGKVCKTVSENPNPMPANPQQPPLLRCAGPNCDDLPMPNSVYCKAHR